MRDAFPRQESKIIVSLGVKHRSPASAVRPSVTFMVPVSSKGNVSRISGGFRFGSSRGAARLIAGGDLLSMELGARLELLEQLRVLTHLTIYPERVSLQRLGSQSMLGRHARLSLLRQWFRGNGFAHLLLLRAGSPVLEARLGVEGLHQSQSARAA